ncbi:winged helix-turn-helix domain-containing protein [Streptomyces polyrhachis]|uniref:Winged helix-turn-helix domain-containing protein n=1 Tax=Streptomyces polyrhachis TaxID=1282885 RepID=A0ABW2GCD7_9ACTN
MGYWRLDADTLAGGRFALSPLSEAVAAFMSLERPKPADPGELSWRADHLPGYRAHVAARPVTAQLADAALGHRNWLADFLTPVPSFDGARTFEEELADIRRTPPGRARAHLVVSRPGPLPPALDRDDLPGLLADLLEWVWTHTVLPTWPRRRRILEADVVARTRRLTEGGWAAVLDDMRPGMRWLGESRLQINAHDHPPQDLSGRRLLFVPVTPHRGWVSYDHAGKYAVVYPCSGVLAEAGRTAVPAALAALLGPARAAVLELLGTPLSTTQLTALTGQGLGSVGRHLRVLLDARLVARRRSGRSVLYFRTAAGDVLVRAQQD